MSEFIDYGNSDFQRIRKGFYKFGSTTFQCPYRGCPHVLVFCKSTSFSTMFEVSNELRCEIP